MTNPNYLILSCDGGGIRGLITAVLLDDLNSNHPETKNILDRVDLFVGSSTGGIIALGLAAGVAPAKLVDLYQNRGADIFKLYQPGLGDEVRYILDYVREITKDTVTNDADERDRGLGLDLEWGAVAKLLGSLFHVKYDSSSLLSVMKDTVPQRKLGEVRSVMVTTFQLSDDSQMWMPIQLHNLPDSPYCDIPIYDAALATGAAPTFFPPHQVAGVGYCTDGGLYANNPTPLAVSLAHSKASVPLSTIKMLGLGTGFTQACVVDVGNPLSWGPAQWLMPRAIGAMPAAPLLESLITAQMEFASAQSQLLIGAQNFMYANVPLNGPYALDNYKDVQKLIDQTHDYINGKPLPAWANVPKWADVVSWVGQTFQ